MTTNTIRREFDLTYTELSKKYGIPMDVLLEWDTNCSMPVYLFSAICMAESYRRDYMELRNCIANNIAHGVELVDLPDDLKHLLRN